MDELTDVEKEYLDRFINYKKRDDDEVKAFIRLIIGLREQPDKNPSLKGAKL